MFSALRRPSAPETVSINIGIIGPILTSRVTPKQVAPPKVMRVSPSILRFRIKGMRINLESFEAHTRRLRCKPSITVEWQLVPERVIRKSSDSPETLTVSSSVMRVPVTTSQINLESFIAQTRRLGFRPSVTVEWQLVPEQNVATASVDTSLQIPFTSRFDVSLSTSTVCRPIPRDREVEVYRHKSSELRIAAPAVKSIPMVIKSPRTLGAIYYKFETTPIDRAGT